MVRDPGLVGLSRSVQKSPFGLGWVRCASVRHPILLAIQNGSALGHSGTRTSAGMPRCYCCNTVAVGAVLLLVGLSMITNRVGEITYPTAPLDSVIKPVGSTV